MVSKKQHTGDTARLSFLENQWCSLCYAALWVSKRTNDVRSHVTQHVWAL